ncbi:hypothetical protein [Shewanella fidelis]|uniref:Uncharacterized protein n=1 Tax=Shewanella fidelis TaxID=173509 RepID=A0AAW8NK44_9GAMM|nr:hypothetical protein [Shewanella fidelis]MDR8522566.1 hypothetical protein [Shewanella fidelis]MDW4812182.1 hypothetical protein [Shewanella fidelis]MDW4816154.1 hypothetical protein [Shewanella fidelis]MDW4820423.1 hypothetical protein [Shewanella fidelis]MDW4824645.1 hypothetical protein [Shewanella fidelis]
MKLLPTFLFLVIAPISTLTFATNNYHVECESCVSEADFKQAAKDNAIHRQTVFINVMNINSFEIRKYRVYKNSRTVCDPNGREPDGEGGFIQDCWLETTLEADKVNLTNSEVNNFIDFASASIELKKSMFRATIEIPKEVVENGYELIGASYMETKVVNHFNSLPISRTILHDAILYLSSATKLASNGLVFNAPAMVFKFSDNSTAYAEIDFIDMNDKLHYKFTKVIDAKGNQIDLQSDNPFPKRLNVGGLSLTSWQSLHSAFKAYGLAVRGATTKIVPRGTVTVIDCSGSTETVCKNPQ